MSPRGSTDRAGRRLTERVRALSEAVNLADGRADGAVVAEAGRVVDQAGRRLAFSGDHTVVALAGATGSGKSSAFNAISGTELAEPGVRRPTTAAAMAAVWGSEPAGELLDWLAVPRRHDLTGSDPRFDGLVLLDLPDHDSTELTHRLEVDRLVQLVDMLVWVVDPQKYADAALHDRYLAPLADHAEVMTIVLNQSDRLTPEQLAACLRDLRRLLDSEGLARARVLSMSTVTGAGVSDLRTLIAEAVHAKQMAAARLTADVSAAASALAADLGDAPARDVSDARAGWLARALGEAAGVPVVSEAVLGAMRRRGTLATGWPALSWVVRLRPDPLRRLHLDRLTGSRGRPAVEPVRIARTALPASTSGVQRARVDTAVRTLADEAASGLPRGWADAVRRASRDRDAQLSDDLDRAVATADLGVDRGHGYWPVFQVLQWVLIGIVVAGLLWLGVDVALLYFQLPPLPTMYSYHRIGLPTLAVIGGVVAGLLLALVGRLLVELTARAASARATRSLTAAVGEVARRDVVEPVDAELRRYRGAREAVARAR
ncbi:MAG TPA: ABC transporter [Propionibacteriaceae bacterium]|nr:ABC transporter [Propionibacteriaceae bacterium]